MEGAEQVIMEQWIGMLEQCRQMVGIMVWGFGLWICAYAFSAVLGTPTVPR